MSWKDTLWSAYKYTYDTSISVISSTLTWAGNLASLAGGSAIAISYAVDESLNAGYYGNGDLDSSIQLNLTAVELHYTYLQTIHFSKDGHSGGQFSYTLKDYLQADTLRLAGSLLSVSGIVLKSAGAHMSLWQQSYKDREILQQEYHLQLAAPSWKEYGLAHANAISEAVVLMTTANALLGTFIQFSPWIGKKYPFTYPDESNQSISSADYTGPVTTQMIPYHFIYQNSTTVNAYGMHIHVLETANVSLVVNATYGAGVFFNSHGHSVPTIAPAAAIAAGAYLANNLFSHKATMARNQRLLEAKPSHEDNYSLLENQIQGV